MHDKGKIQRTKAKAKMRPMSVINNTFAYLNCQDSVHDNH